MPLNETIALVRRSLNGDFITIVERSLTSGDGSATHGLVVSQGDFIFILLEVGHIIGITSDREVAVVVLADHFAVQRPVHEVPASSLVSPDVDNGAQIDCSIIVNKTDLTGFSGIGLNSDVIHMLFEVGDHGHITGQLEGVAFSVGADLFAVNRPVHKVIAFV